MLDSLPHSLHVVLESNANGIGASNALSRCIGVRISCLVLEIAVASPVTLRNLACIFQPRFGQCTWCSMYCAPGSELPTLQPLFVV